MLNVAMYWALRAAAWNMQFVPLRLMYALANWAGTCAYFLVPRARRGILANLMGALPQSPGKDLRRLAMQTFRHDARNWVDTLRIPRLTTEEILSSVDVDGWEHLQSAHRGGKGVVCVTMHLGNFDLVGQLLGARGYRLTMPVERMQPPQLFDFLVKQRASRGIEIVPVDRAPRHMLRALRRGDLVGLAGDRDFTGHGKCIDFFGRPTLMPIGAATLFRHTGAPVLVAIGVRTQGHCYGGFLSAPLPMQRTGDAQLDDIANTQLIAQELEHFVRRYPDQWLAFTPLWSSGTLLEDTATIGQQKEAAV